MTPEDFSDRIVRSARYVGPLRHLEGRKALVRLPKTSLERELSIAPTVLAQFDDRYSPETRPLAFGWHLFLAEEFELAETPEES